MSTNESNSGSSHTNAAFGFLDVIELPSAGFCGGLLIVSNLGRPLEFHCTAPVVVNRGQQILYGATYRGFLFAEQIGTALVDKAKHQPTLFLISSPDLMAISQVVDPPVVMVQAADDDGFDGAGLDSFSIDDTTFWAASGGRDRSLQATQNHISTFHKKLPVDEPFERIASAIEEAYAGLRVA